MKVLVLVVIVVGVAGVWAIKNGDFIEEVQKVDSLQQPEVKQEESLQIDDTLGTVDQVTERVVVEEPKVIEQVESAQSIEEEETTKPFVPEKKPEVSEPVIEEPEKEPLEEIAPQEEVEANNVETPDLVAKEFDLEKLKSYGLPIMIEFGASWCTWCRWMEPTLEELNEEYAGKVVIQSVDVEKFREETSDFNVSLLPTIYFFDAEGNVFETRVGAMTKEEILQVFESMGVEK